MLVADWFGRGIAGAAADAPERSSDREDERLCGASVKRANPLAASR
jgi:hypothetical protein